MSFLYGKKDEFEKDNNTIRELYKFVPSQKFLHKLKHLSLPKIWILKEESYSDSITPLGGITFFTEITKNDYTEYAFLIKDYSETIESLGGVVFKTEKAQNDFIEYAFLTYPYTGYVPDTIEALGGVIFKTEGGNFD